MRRAAVSAAAMILSSVALVLCNAPVSAAGAARAPADAAGAAPAATVAQTLEETARRFAESGAAALAGRAGMNVEVKVERLDARLQPAACARLEAFLPGSARLWGRTRIGVRCAEGPHWTIYVPVDVRVFGPALLVARPVASGQPLGEEDWRIEQVELSRDAPGVLADPLEASGKLAARALAPGMPLRAEYLQARPVIQQGDPVRVVFLGSGFTVESEGVATAAAGEGQTVRVKVESGRVISGTAHDGHRVEIR